MLSRHYLRSSHRRKGYDSPRSIWATYRFRTGRGQFYLGPYDRAVAVAAALSGADCRGRECAPMPPFDVLTVQGEGLIIDRGELTEGVSCLVWNLSTRVGAQWVALSQDAFYVNSGGNTQVSYKYNKGIRNILQRNQRLHCLLMSAIRGP